MAPNATLSPDDKTRKTGDITSRILMSIVLSFSVGLSLLLVLSLHPVNGKVSLLLLCELLSAMRRRLADASEEKEEEEGKVFRRL